MWILKPSLKNTTLKTKLCLSKRLSMNIILGLEAKMVTEIIAFLSYEVDVQVIQILLMRIKTQP